MFTGDDDQVVGEFFPGVSRVASIAGRLAMSTRIVGKPRVALCSQCLSGAKPGPAGLAEAMCKQERAVSLQRGGGGECSGRQLQAARTGQRPRLGRQLG